ncbi:MAG TPA: BCAM0308 family protein [Gallionella sp.]|nr:BCAM0308 family protein [Gallionella sp.]
MSHSTHPPGFHLIRRDRLQQETVLDSYKSKGKLAEPTVCPDCGAVFHGGRWQWLEKPQGAHSETCPACHRMRDRFPAGHVFIGGQFLGEHEAEIMQLVKHHEAREKAEHPMQRIMDIEKTEQGYQVTTTDIHLARGIGDALHHAYQGQLEFHYNPDQNLLRVNWHR